MLSEGLQRHPQAREMLVFLAMVRHNLGQSKQAVESLLKLLAETSADPEIRAYAAAIGFYAEDVDRIWPADPA